MSVLRKVKALITGERQDLQTGEVIGRLPGHYERPDPTPLAPPVGFKREPTLMEKIQLMMLKDRVQRLQDELGAESPEEAEDFEIDGEDLEPGSPYEFDRHEEELLERVAKAQARHIELQKKYPKHDFGPIPFTDEFPIEGVRGPTAPEGGAPAPVPAPAKGASGAAEPPPSEVPLTK